MPKAPTTFTQYVAGLPASSRPLARALAAAVRRAAPKSTIAIKYGIPAFLDDGQVFLYVAVWKSHVGVYPIYRGDPAVEAKVGAYRDQKDTLRFPLEAPLPLITWIARHKLRELRAKA